MEDAELAKKMLADLEDNRDKEAKNLLEGLNETRLTSLRESIEEIFEQIKMREKLHTEMMNDLETLKSSINNMMPSTPDPSPEFQKAVVEFQKQLIDADEMKVQEKLNCFRDVALLKKELREIIREFRDKETRADLLGGLLSE